MLKNLKKRSEGFTIIEVLIVLAIAGLILLIVFLAVPALQRNSRNTQRRNDVAVLLGGVTEFINNNSGTLPTSLRGTTNPYTFRTAACSATATGTAAEVKLGYYVQTACSDVATGTQAALTTDTFKVVTGAKCTTAGGSDSSGAAARSVAVLFMVESGTSLAPTCQEG